MERRRKSALATMGTTIGLKQFRKVLTSVVVIMLNPFLTPTRNQAIIVNPFTVLIHTKLKMKKERKMMSKKQKVRFTTQ